MSFLLFTPTKKTVVKHQLKFAALLAMCSPATAQLYYFYNHDVTIRGLAEVELSAEAGPVQTGVVPFPQPKLAIHDLPDLTGGTCQAQAGTDWYDPTWPGVLVDEFWPPIAYGEAQAMANSTDFVLATNNKIHVDADYDGDLTVAADYDAAAAPCGPSQLNASATAKCTSTSSIHVKFFLTTPSNLVANAKLVLAEGADQNDIPESLSTGTASWLIRDLSPPPPPANPIVASGSLNGVGPLNQVKIGNFLLQPDGYQLEVTVEYQHGEKALASPCVRLEVWGQPVDSTFDLDLSFNPAPINPGNGVGN